MGQTIQSFASRLAYGVLTDGAKSNISSSGSTSFAEAKSDGVAAVSCACASEEGEAAVEEGSVRS